MLALPRSHRTVLVGLWLAFNQVGCTGMLKQAKMDPALPIDTEHGYRQRGEVLERADMLDKLEREPQSASSVQTARTLSTLSLILASVSGALIGWPLGEKVAGEDPHWGLAIAGGGIFAVALPLALVADGNVSGAVREHNAALESQASEQRAQR